MGSTIQYSPLLEARSILDQLCSQADILGLPPNFKEHLQRNVSFESDHDRVYFPIPFKETETTAALKAIEGGVAAAIWQLRGGDENVKIVVNLEKTTCFLFQAYLSTIGGLWKQSVGVKAKLKDTDFLQAQSDPYRRMSANLYQTKEPERYYHIHGSLEATTQLRQIGLAPFRPDLQTHEEITTVIQDAVKGFTVGELEDINKTYRQAGVEALKHEDFLKTPHGQVNSKLPPWSLISVETDTPPAPLPPLDSSSSKRVLAGIKVLELCRIIAGPTIGRILAEYGATVLKVTGPGQSDVPFFQVDGNMGKHSCEIDLKSSEGQKVFEALLDDVDIIVDGYRPGAIENLGYGPDALKVLAKRRGKGFVYVNENCFGFQGEWADRAGWQQIADCVSGLAWAQGQFMGLEAPVVPPFPISDYGTGCMGAIAALSGLHARTIHGGSYHGKASLLGYDLLLFRVGLYSHEIRSHLQSKLTAPFRSLSHSHSVDDISKTAREMMKSDEWGGKGLFTKDRMQTWWSEKYGEDISVVEPVVSIAGLDIGFTRGSRPNGSDEATWEFGKDADYRR